MFSKINNGIKRLMNSEVQSDCGHVTRMKGKITYFKPDFDGGESIKIGLNIILNNTGKASECFNCIEESCIRCTWCGGTIMPGEPITLLSPAKDDFIVPEYAVEYNPEQKERSAYVGCLRWDCADSGVFFSGHWGSGHQVHRIKSPLQQVMETGKPVIVNL